MSRRIGMVALAVLAIVAFAGWTIVRSVPADPSEITAGIAAVPAGCRDLARARVTARIASEGAISRRQLEIMLAMECGVSARQYGAAAGR